MRYFSQVTHRQGQEVVEIEGGEQRERETQNYLRPIIEDTVLHYEKKKVIFSFQIATPPSFRSAATPSEQVPILSTEFCLSLCLIILPVPAEASLFMPLLSLIPWSKSV